MRKTAILGSCLILVLLTSLIPLTILGQSPDNRAESETYRNTESSSEDPWWMHWSRDKNQNGIDDLIDEKISSGSTERVSIYLKYDRDIDEMDSEGLSAFDLEVGYVFEFINTISARNVDLDDIPQLGNLPGVGMIELQMPIESHLDVSNSAIKARESSEYSPKTAWELGFSGDGINIAIVDTGVDDNHESLMGKFVAGVSFDNDITPKDGSFNPNDEVGHGTYCAGIALGTGGTTDFNFDGEPDYMGVAPDAKLIDVQYAQGAVAVSDAMTRSIEWCVEYKDEDWEDQPDEFDGIDVISISSNIDGTPGEAAQVAAESGLIVVTSGGNDGPNNPPPSVTAWPDKVIVVASVFDQETVDRDDDTIAVSSSRGPRTDGAFKPDIAAPGQFITAPTRDSYKRYGLPTGIEGSGTSFAAPHVAGVAALLLEVAPDLSSDEMLGILHDTAEARGDPYDPDIDDKYNTDFGWGIVDAYEAVLRAQDYDDRPPILTDIQDFVSGITATITWQTHKEANSTIMYGESSSQLDDILKDENFTIDHTITITDYNFVDLKENFTYYYKILSWDKHGHGPSESDVLEFTTEVLPDSTPPKILDLEIIGKSDTTATIYWNTNEHANGRVDYGLTEEYDDNISMITLSYAHSITLFDLQPETTYHFRVNSSDVSGNGNQSEDYDFQTLASPDEDPPFILDNWVRVVDITDTTATLRWETNEPSTRIVRIGESLSYGLEYKATESFWLRFTLKLTGLKPSTVYYYQVESTDPSGNVDVFGDINEKFNTTGPPDHDPPVIIDGPDVEKISDTSATIEWTTDEKSDGCVEYGLSDNYGSKEPKNPTGEFLLVHRIKLTDLSPETTYHFRVRSKDNSPNENEVISDDLTFTTEPPPDLKPPKILAGPDILAVGETTATITWTTNEDSDSMVMYGTDLTLDSEVGDTLMVKDHLIFITGLSSATTYYYKVNSSDDSGNGVESDISTFTTLDITLPIEIKFFNLQSGKIIRGVVTIEGEVTGGRGDIEYVRYKIDNGTWLNLGSGSTFSIVLDGSQMKEGEHTLYVETRVGVMTMQEDTLFMVEHSDEDGDIFSLWILFAAIAMVVIFVVAVAVVRSSSRRKTRGLHYTDLDEHGPPFSQDYYPPAATESIGFIPDEVPQVPFGAESIGFIPEEEPEEYPPAESAISFIPEETYVSEDPEVAFVPSMGPISFNIEKPEPVKYDTVRCPRCKTLFNADTSKKIECPDCGFSADLR